MEQVDSLTGKTDWTECIERDNENQVMLRKSSWKLGQQKRDNY